jgi:hypothetical protein
MFKRLFLLLVALTFQAGSYAQMDSSRLRLSLLTCGTGPEVWETFGHTALRVTDSINGTDNVYNYGTFAFGDDFALQFARGKLLYYLSFYPYSVFVDEYASVGRSVEEQELLMDGATEKNIFAFLQNNALEENRYYKYDFFYDNCATRIRDVFPRALGKSFVFGKTIASKERLSYRNIINQYYYYKHWERFGINILLGSRIDSVMDNEDIMFLPDFLRDGIGNATVNGRTMSTKPVLIVPGSERPRKGVDWPFVSFSIVAVLTILGILLPGLNPVGKVMSFLLLIVTGLLGILMLVMWLATDHQGCQNNFNILWALPTNVILAFAPKRNKSKYAAIAIILMIASFCLHLLKIQELPLFQLAPLLLALLFVYGMIYRRAKQTS